MPDLHEAIERLRKEMGPDGIFWGKSSHVADVLAAYDAERPTVDPRDVPAGTGNAEADRLIGRLCSADPDFQDCMDAAIFIRKLVCEHKGPDGFATWKDAAVHERVLRVNAERGGEAVVWQCRRLPGGEWVGMPKSAFDAMRERGYDHELVELRALYTHPAQPAAVVVDEAMARDAERYRFLRSDESRDHAHHTRRAMVVAEADWSKNFTPGSKPSMWTYRSCCGGKMDAAVDAAMHRAAAPSPDGGDDGQ